MTDLSNSITIPETKNMSNPTIAQKSPIAVDVVAGKTYYWCACGRSKKQPFCDSTHQGSEFNPLPFTPEQSGQLYFCACKNTKNSPMCDGSHKAL